MEEYSNPRKWMKGITTTCSFCDNILHSTSGWFSQTPVCEDKKCMKQKDAKWEMSRCKSALHGLK